MSFITTKRKEVMFCFSLPIGPNKIVPQENNNILGEILVSFPCFLNPFPETEKCHFKMNYKYDFLFLSILDHFEAIQKVVLNHFALGE